jgi:Polysaccharide lyase
MMSLDRKRVRRRFVVFGLLAFAAISTTALAASAVAHRSSSSRSRNALHRGRIVYRENWETGALDTSQWGAQCSNLTQTDFATGSFAPEQTVVGQGRWAARFDLPADTMRSSSCELIHNRTLDLGTDDYYALEVYFPTNWREPGDQSRSFWGMAIAQFNYEIIWAGPVDLYAHRNYVNLTVMTGYFNGSTTRWYTGNGIGRGNLPRMYAIPRPLKLGVWHQLIVHVHWTTGKNGVVDVWHRVRGRRRWRRTVHFLDYPTVQWSATKPTTSSMRTWDKIGAYRGQSSFPLSIWNDGFCRASSFKAAKSCL